MKHIYTATYVLIFIRFLREMIREICPDPGAKKMCLYIELPHRHLSVRLATSVSLSRLEQAKAELIAENWSESYLHITDGVPKYEPINIESPRILSIYDRGTVNELLENVRKFIKTPNM